MAQTHQATSSIDFVDRGRNCPDLTDFDPDDYLLPDDPPINNKRAQLTAAHDATVAYLAARKPLHMQVVRAFWAYYEIDTLIPQHERNFGSGHFFTASSSTPSCSPRTASIPSHLRGRRPRSRG